MDVAVANNNIGRNKIHPQKFALWIACASILMMFFAFTSAYIIRHAVGNWLEFRLPDLFFYNTGIIIISSIVLHASYTFFKRGNELLYKTLLSSGFILGLLFLVLQYKGWEEMQNIGIYLNGNPSGSFIYVISGVHAAHILGGLTAMIIAMIHAFVLDFKVTAKRKLRFELVLTYWHFVGFLWVYLLIFFIMQ